MEENQSNSLRRSYNNHRVHHDKHHYRHNSDAHHGYHSKSRERKEKQLEQTMMTHTQTTIDVSSPHRNKVPLESHQPDKRYQLKQKYRMEDQGVSPPSHTIDASRKARTGEHSHIEPAYESRTIRHHVPSPKPTQQNEYVVYSSNSKHYRPAQVPEMSNKLPPIHNQRASMEFESYPRGIGGANYYVDHREAASRSPHHPDYYEPQPIYV